MEEQEKAELLERMERMERTLEKVISSLENLKERLARMEIEMRKKDSEMEEMKRKLEGRVEGIAIEVGNLKGSIKELKREMALREVREG